MGSHWKDDLCTGQAVIDGDHQELLGILEGLDSASRCGFGAQARGLLGEFLTECGAHFAREEALMAEVGFASAVAHREAHALYLDDLRRFLKSAPPPESPGFRLYVGSRLLGWFLQHIKAYDAPLAAAALHHAPRAPEAVTPPAP